MLKGGGKKIVTIITYCAILHTSYASHQICRVPTLSIIGLLYKVGILLMHALVRLRTRQIRFSSRLIGAVAGRGKSRLLALARRVPGLERLLVGYLRPFATLEAASEALRGFDNEGHRNPHNAELHLGLDAPRASDYAVMLHIEHRRTEISRVFDLGGNVGNLYYCYSKYISFRKDLKWIVFDLPEITAFGRKVAAERAAGHLEFCEDFRVADGVDLFIASGSAHYFASPLAQMVCGLAAKPRFVVINRSPMTDGDAFATVQDASVLRVACMVYQREATIDAFREAGYRLVDQWDAPELSLRIPFHPEHSVSTYSGMFFELEA
jgi:putative methyltransferase (TIGR04325 family)